MKKINKTTTSLILLGLITNINTAYAFQSRELECAMKLLPIFAISVITAIVALIMTIISLSSKKKDKDKKIKKWLITTIAASVIVFIILSLRCY